VICFTQIGGSTRRKKGKAALIRRKPGPGLLNITRSEVLKGKERERKSNVRSV